MKIGDSTSSVVTYTSEKVKIFSEISGDINPIHLDNNFAKDTIFGKPIVHGMFVASQISALIANELPGPGSIYLFQDLNFILPVYHNDIVTCTIKITEIKELKKIITINTICNNQIGEKVIEGKAIIKLI